jgi:hypothetical protein
MPLRETLGLAVVAFFVALCSIVVVAVIHGLRQK